MKSLFKLIKLIRPISLIRLIRPIKFIKPARYKFITACLILSLALGGLFFTASSAHAGWPSWLKAPVVFVKKALAVIGGNITGEGTISFLPLFTGAVGVPSNTIGDSIVYDDGAGHIGIRTVTPQSILHTRGSNGVPAISGNMNTGIIFSSGIGAPSLNLGSYDSGAQLTSYGFITSAYENNAGVFLPLALQPNGGNVGIGTTAPLAKLYVRDADNTTDANIGQFFAQNLTQGIGIGYNRIEAVGSNVDQHILIIPKGAAGNVGIGTAAPGYKLDVQGGWIRLTGTGSFGDPATRIGIYDSDNTGGVSGWWFSQNQDGKMAIHQNGIGDRLTIDGSGNVGIGTAAPRAQLEVNGSIILTPQALNPASPVNGQMWMLQ